MTTAPRSLQLVSFKAELFLPSYLTRAGLTRSMNRKQVGIGPH